MARSCLSSFGPFAILIGRHRRRCRCRRHRRRRLHDSPPFQTSMPLHATFKYIGCFYYYMFVFVDISCNVESVPAVFIFVIA